MHFVYILYSEKLKKYYIGETYDVALRLEQHNSSFYDNQWTGKGKPWKLVFQITCTDKKQAHKIEQHIKRMKSRKYIENLQKHIEIVQKLKLKYTL